jgi:hypothetical protein
MTELLTRNKFRFQLVVFAKLTDVKHAKSQHMPLFIYPLHERIMRDGPHETRCLTKLHFTIVRLGVKPNLYFFGHSDSPGFS